MNIDNNTKFDFDDILIKPSITTRVNSRYNDIKLPTKLPIFTAPMDTVVNLNNVEEFIDINVNVILPRTVKYDNNLIYFINHHPSLTPLIFISFGLEEIELHLKKNLKEIYKNAHILIDIANGHIKKLSIICQKIKKLRPDIIIMIGNIANPETYRHYAELQCISFIRIGVGNGGACITTKQSGIGYPMASLIHEIRLIKNELLKKYSENQLPKIVADGGLKDYSDIVKAHYLGADYVILGSIFNKAIESAGDDYLYGIKINNKLAKFLFKYKFPIKKYFRGMSTKQAQKAMGKTKFKTSEGVVRFRKVEYTLETWISNYIHYLRNAMSYTDSKNLEEFIGGGNFINITQKSYDRFNK